MENSIQLKTITELLGLHFHIPSYQRGYRWTQTNVHQLLDDIWEYRQKPSNSNTFYCLQPLVVRKATWQDPKGLTVEGYELIDGQQRLTTLHRIITYLQLEHLRNTLQSAGYSDPLYSIHYETRPESNDFLSSNASRDDVPDLYYMSQAYLHIKAWFEQTTRGIHQEVRNDMLKIILPGLQWNPKGERSMPEWSVQVIWYEINDENQKGEDLFARLNRGKIPLTSAELIKAKFVNADSFAGMSEADKIRRRTLLVQLWDEMENALNNPRFWAFISNHSMSRYNTKIEILFDIATGRKDDELDPLFSFLHFFDRVETADSLWQKWLDIEEMYRSLVFWFTDKALYHKVGYLITFGTSVRELIRLKKEHTKDGFRESLNSKISAGLPPNWDQLRYDKTSDPQNIHKVLLLANLEMAQSHENSHDVFPFEWYKGSMKSLEHIHAQNIEDISKTKSNQWKDWLHAHLSVLPGITHDKEAARELSSRINGRMDEITYDLFKGWSKEILDLVPKAEEDETEHLHTMANMALLGREENSALKNAIFEVKRQKIVEMDMRGIFIPLATKRVFLKYYAKDSSLHYSTWTSLERESYLKDIGSAIQHYLPKTSSSNA